MAEDVSSCICQLFWSRPSHPRPLEVQSEQRDGCKDGESGGTLLREGNGVNNPENRCARSLRSLSSPLRKQKLPSSSSEGVFALANVCKHLTRMLVLCFAAEAIKYLRVSKCEISQVEPGGYYQGRIHACIYPLPVLRSGIYQQIR